MLHKKKRVKDFYPKILPNTPQYLVPHVPVTNGGLNKLRRKRLKNG